MFDKKLKKLLYLLSDLKIDLKNPCSVRTQTKRNNEQLILVLVDPVDDEDEDPGPQTSGPPTDNVRSKEMEEY
jgi:hypothetical protein